MKFVSTKKGMTRVKIRIRNPESGINILDPQHCRSVLHRHRNDMRAA
jgi:hypothetical protein